MPIKRRVSHNQCHHRHSVALSLGSFLLKMNSPNAYINRTPRSFSSVLRYKNVL
jgi:hypothetical protein